MAPPRRAAAVSAASNLASSATGNRTVSESKPKGTGNKGHNGQQPTKDTVAAAPIASSSKPPPPVIPLSPIVGRLRTMWKFAAICQFLFTFDEAFGFSGFETEALENDLDGPETRVIPDLFRRLLYTLTLNRTIDDKNWEDHLRKQYINREPEAPLLGTIEEPISWHALPLQQKVDSIHTLCEWQLWDAEKFRKLVKNEEEAEVWRIDPIGWDAEDNTYWLFDDNRLWIQHPPPAEPAAPKSKAPPKKSSKKAKAEARREAQKRKREAEANGGSSSNAGTPAKSARSTPAKSSSRLPRTPPTRSSPRTRLANGESAPKQLRSTRSSRRTGDWEEVPPELLYDGDSDLSDPPEDETTAMEVDNTADIELKDECDEREAMKKEEVIEGETEGAESKEEREEGAAKVEDPSPISTNIAKEEGDVNASEADEKEENPQSEKMQEEEKPEWIEFEALVVSRQDWEWMSTRFAKSKHPDEKALHQLLKDTVLPKVIADLDEADKQRAHELAMANRKRSSRIALKESEREEKERDRIARQKMEDKMAAIRAEEEEKARKEQEEMNLTRVREERLREREERAIAREREAEERVQREIDEREERERLRELRKLKREQIIANGGQPPDDDHLFDAQGTGQDDDSWELDCEVCGKNGINLDDTDEIVCCEQCGKWQHTDCWNAFDRRIGRSKRDWENEDFYCSNCRPPPLGQPRPKPPTFVNFAQSGLQSQSHSSNQSSQANTPIVPSQRSPIQETFAYPSAAAYSVERNERQQNSFPNYTTLYGNYQNSVPQPHFGHPLSQQQPHHAHSSASQTSNSQFVRPSPNQTVVGHPTAHDLTGGVSAAIGQQRPPQASHTPHPVPSDQVRMQTVQESPQMAQRSLTMQAPGNHAMGAPRAPQANVGHGQSISAPTHASAQNPTGQTSQQASTIPSAYSLPPPSSPTNSQSNGTSAQQPRYSPGPGKPSGSPSYVGQNAQHGYPARSPGSMNGGQSVPRNIAHQPSGSFPLRHTPARSPLSGPHRESPSSMPNMSIGPPVRSISPSPASGLNRQVQQAHQNTPLTAGRAPQLSHELLHSRQPSTGGSDSGNAAPTAERAAVRPLSYSSPNSSQAPETGPGPSSGSLARPTTVQSPNRPSATLPPAAQAALTTGTSHPIPAPAFSDSNSSSTSAPMNWMRQSNGISDSTSIKNPSAVPSTTSEHPHSSHPGGSQTQNAPQTTQMPSIPSTNSTSNANPQN